MNSLDLLRVNSTLDDIKNYDWLSFLQLIPLFRPLACTASHIRVNIIDKDDTHIVQLVAIKNGEVIGTIYFKTNGLDPTNDFLSQVKRMTPNKEEPSFLRKDC